MRGRIAAVAVILVIGLVMAEALLQGEPPAASSAHKDGWWIKINTDRTQCDTIRLDIGVNKESRVEWCVWHKGEAAEFDVKEGYRQVAALYIHATVNPVKKIGAFSMMYKNNGVKHFSLDDQAEDLEPQSHYDSDAQ
jgi:hypothetical protein